MGADGQLTPQLATRFSVDLTIEEPIRAKRPGLDRPSACGAARIGAKYGGLVRFHYLPMPALLRRSGSFGTHWMMQEQIRVREDAPCKGRTYTLTGDEVLAILRALQHESLPSGASAEAQAAHKFILSESDNKSARVFSVKRDGRGSRVPERHVLPMNLFETHCPITLGVLHEQ